EGGGVGRRGEGRLFSVAPPQLLKKKLRLAACIDEYQRGLVTLDLRVNFSKRMTRRMAGPWQMLLGIEHRDDRLGTSLRHNQVGKRPTLRRLWHQKSTKLVRFGDGRGKADRGQFTRELEQASQTERQQVAAL